MVYGRVEIDCDREVARAIMYIVDVRDAVCPIRIKRKVLTGYKMLINSCDFNHGYQVPLVDFVLNFVNGLGNISGSVPQSVSDMLTTISWAVMLTVPSFVNLMALVRRFDIT